MDTFRHLSLHLQNMTRSEIYLDIKNMTFSRASQSDLNKRANIYSCNRCTLGVVHFRMLWFQSGSQPHQEIQLRLGNS